MKTTKKIFAGLLSAALIATMVPFSASAVVQDKTYTANINGKAGYTFKAYKVADLTLSTGQYSNAINEDVQTALNAGDNVELLEACDNVDYSTATAAATFTFAADATGDALTQEFLTTEPGVYYFAVTGVPQGYKGITQNSVISLPYYEDGNYTDGFSVDLGAKVSDETLTINKKFTNTDNREISEYIGKDISYTLTASVIGSVEEKATYYRFVDTMTDGLTFTKINSVKLTGKKDAEAKILTTNDYTSDFNNQVLTVELKKTVLDSDYFYDYTTVEVVYNAQLNTEAVLGVKEESQDVQNAVVGETDLSTLTFANNVNSVNLEYKNKFTAEGETDKLYGPKLTVYTFKLDVKKVDATTNQPLSGCTFELSSIDANFTNTTATTGEDGTVEFKGLKAGTYTVKETVAPTGYNLGNNEFTVVIDADGKITSGALQNGYITATNYKIVTPNTGGTGTMVFTVVGISLIACGSVLLLIVMKKKKASK